MPPRDGVRRRGKAVESGSPVYGAGANTLSWRFRPTSTATILTAEGEVIPLPIMDKEILAKTIVQKIVEMFGE